MRETKLSESDEEIALCGLDKDYKSGGFARVNRIENESILEKKTQERYAEMSILRFPFQIS